MTENKEVDVSTPGVDFVRALVAADQAAGRWQGRVHTRFPPEPNGYLHLGHAKAISVNFNLAAEFGGRCNLRFDDTNPLAEDTEYVDSIREDIRWLGFDWGQSEFFASDYFEQLYCWAEKLVEEGKAYVDSSSRDALGEQRGPWHEAGKESPFRERLPAENLDLLRRMRAGEFADGEHVLRAKIDMASGNMNLRDPVMYRIRRVAHHRTGAAWCIYPTYDWAHGQSDAIEGVTHSICTLEFEDHRPLYEWYLNQIGVGEPPQQIEFARLNISYCVLSKRRLMSLVKDGLVDGWDDPRLPTLRGLRRRGYSAQSIRDFASRLGVTKRESVVDLALLEHCLREDLNHRAQRRMAVLKPLRVIIENYPEGQVEHLEATNNPEDPVAGTRQVPFSRELFIERDDFMEDPPKKFFRLAPGREVRLRYGYFVTCREVIKEGDQVVALRCTYDPETRGGNAPDGRRVKATLHWVSAAHAIEGEVRLYDRLFQVATPGASGGDFREDLNPTSLQVVRGCRLEPALADFDPDVPVQFERLGYFVLDNKSDHAAHLVWNRAVTLKDAWAKLQQPA